MRSKSSLNPNILDEVIGVQTTSLYRSLTFHPFILHTDASKQGLGEVFYQNQGGKMRVIIYGSHTLTPAEQRYHLHSSNLKFLSLMSNVWQF